MLIVDNRLGGVYCQSPKDPQVAADGGSVVEVDRILSTCQTCDGRIYAQTNAIRTVYTGGWLHLHDADWRHAPHNASPTPEAARRVHDWFAAQ